MFKQFLEEQIFYKVSYGEDSLRRGKHSLNCIKVLNNGWWGSVDNIFVKFNVCSPQHNTNYPKHAIYVDYLGKQVLIVDTKGGQSFVANFDNDQYDPELAIMTEAQGVTIDLPIALGADDYEIRVNCKKLKAKKDFTMTILWFTESGDKEIKPVVKVNGRVCSRYDKRSVWNKFHLLPVLLCSLAILCIGIQIGIYVGGKLALANRPLTADEFQESLKNFEITLKDWGEMAKSAKEK